MFAVPLFNYYHVAISCYIPTLTIFCAIIKLFSKNRKNMLLAIFFFFELLEIVNYMAMSINASVPITNENITIYTNVGIINRVIQFLIIIISVFFILKNRLDFLMISCAWVMVLVPIVTNFYIWDYNVKSNTDYFIFEYSCIGLPNKEMKDILDVNNYILQKEKEGYKVLILDIEASRYMVPLHRNNYKYDLMLDGNLGFNGEERLIEEIKNIEKLVIIRQKPAVETIDIQQPEKIDLFIETNYKRIGEINNLEIYN